MLNRNLVMQPNNEKQELTQLHNYTSIIIHLYK